MNSPPLLPANEEQSPASSIPNRLRLLFLVQTLPAREWCRTLKIYNIRKTQMFLAAVSLAGVCAWAQTAPLAERVTAQNNLFEEFYEAGLKNSPISATSIGDFRYNAQLDNVSLVEIARIHAENDAFLKRLRKISIAGMGDSDLLSHELLERQLERADIDYELKNYEMPINQQSGIHTELADLPLSVPLDSVQHYKDYIARLHKIPNVLAQVTEVMRAGERDGLMPPKLITEKLAGQCTGIIAADPFLLPLNKFPANFSDADKRQLTDEVTEAVNADVIPAFKKFADFLTKEYAPRGRTELSIESLPDGKRRYAEAVKSMTTVDITPEAVHEIGLKEVARITEEMTALAKAQGYKDLASYRAAVNADPKWKPTSEEQIVADFKKYIDEMQPMLPQLFGLLPKGPVTVEAIPDFAAAEATHYVAGSPDGKRPGRVVVAVANPTTRTMLLDEAVAYHEGVPGHHLQISVAQQLTGLPKFRLRGWYTAYIEGWALYAESLGKEIGSYRDPASDYGRLNSELFRAVRLVVDTGIHDKGWTREQVIDYMHANDVNDAFAQTETDRYIAWPGQALAYKMGQLTIVKLRERAKQALGAGFDIKAFHDEVLNGGAMPLDLLELRVNHWIAAKMPNSTSAVSAAKTTQVRARDLGIPFDGTPGLYNAITDVPGVEVGYKTLISGEGRRVVGKGPVRTGVTAIFPRGKEDGESVFAGFFSGNGNGDMTGTHWIEESGVMETPILITNTLSVGVVRDAAVSWMTRQNRPGNFWYPVVAETADVFLNDIKGQHITKEDTFEALNAASSGPVAEGNVGGGTGMRCNGFKGGSGTSSRLVIVEGHPYTVGVFVQCNYGTADELRIAGIPVAREMKYQHPCFAKPLTPPPDSIFKGNNLPPCNGPFAGKAEYPHVETTGETRADEGSIIVIVATNAPLTPDQLKRLARRVPLGLGRAGSFLGDSSGDLFLAFSTANEATDDGNSTPNAKPPVSRMDRLISSSLNPLFVGTIQATEEAVDNAMVAATTMIGADYMLIPALPHDEVRRVLSEHKLLKQDVPNRTSNFSP